MAALVPMVSLLRGLSVLACQRQGVSLESKHRRPRERGATGVLFVFGMLMSRLAFGLNAARLRLGFVASSEASSPRGLRWSSYKPG